MKNVWVLFLIFFCFLVGGSDVYGRSGNKKSGVKEMTRLDSVNYHFGILLNHERDSINQYHKNDPTFRRLNYVIVETDERKFVNPWKHLEYTVEKIHNAESFYPHTKTNKENFYRHLGTGDFSPFFYKDAEQIADGLFRSWKNSDGHYRFMIQRTSKPNSFWFESRDYTTFKILYINSYRPERDFNHWVFVASFTAWE